MIVPSVQTLLHVQNQSSLPLSFIINESVSSRIFPNSYKHATVVPVFKSGDPHDKANYRPISLLSLYSKIIERCIYNRLVSFLDVNSVITPQQYGFRRGRSTIDALLNLTDFIYDAINDQRQTVGVFVDLKKAFDTVDVDILCRKLSHYAMVSEACLLSGVTPLQPLTGCTCR